MIHMHIGTNQYPCPGHNLKRHVQAAAREYWYQLLFSGDGRVIVRLLGVTQHCTVTLNIDLIIVFCRTPLWHVLAAEKCVTIAQMSGLGPEMTLRNVNV